MECCAHCGAKTPLSVCAQCPEQEVRQKLCSKCMHKHANAIHAEVSGVKLPAASLLVGERVTAETLPVTKSLIDNPDVEPGFMQSGTRVILYWPTPKDSESGGRCGATELARCRDYETAQRITDALKNRFEVKMYGKLAEIPSADEARQRMVGMATTLVNYENWIARIARMKKMSEVDHSDLQNDEAMDRLIQEAREMTGEAPTSDE